MVCILTLFLVLLACGSSASMADVSVPETSADYRFDEFCGNSPPVSVSCPKTGRKVCECYLSPDQDVAEAPPLDHPRKPTIRIKVKPKLVALLPEFESHQLLPLVLNHSLERPPR